jgi:heparin binding hemagglutinin HbhA
MTPTQTVKQYGETVVAVTKTPVLAAIGAGDLAVERALSVARQLRNRAEALPGDAQV